MLSPASGLAAVSVDPAPTARSCGWLPPHAAATRAREAKPASKASFLVDRSPFRGRSLRIRSPMELRQCPASCAIVEGPRLLRAHAEVEHRAGREIKDTRGQPWPFRAIRAHWVVTTARREKRSAGAG